MSDILKQIEKDGANARALGKSDLDNPYAKSESMPANTGESLEEYQAKYNAWERGWILEDAMRNN